MTTNNYWQHTMLLQCSLSAVRNEFLQLCLDLVRFYAPHERHIYYEEDPAIGEHLYLAATRQQQERQRERRRQRRQREEAERGRREGPGRGGGRGAAGAEVGRVVCVGMCWCICFFLGGGGGCGRVLLSVFLRVLVVSCVPRVFLSAAATVHVSATASAAAA